MGVWWPGFCVQIQSGVCTKAKGNGCFAYLPEELLYVCGTGIAGPGMWYPVGLGELIRDAQFVPAPDAAQMDQTGVGCYVANDGGTLRVFCAGVEAQADQDEQQGSGQQDDCQGLVDAVADLQEFSHTRFCCWRRTSPASDLTQRYLPQIFLPVCGPFCR